MKSTILIIAFVILTGTVNGQLSYYRQTGQITGNGFVYQCDNDDGDITLYNTNNRFIYHDWTYQDGSKLEDDILRGNIKTIEFDQKSYGGFFTIIRDGFTPAQKAAIGSYSLFVQAYIDPATGRIADVEFSFYDVSPYSEIPVEVYYNIEQQLKAQQLYKATEVGKKFNYLMHVGAVEINPYYLRNQ